MNKFASKAARKLKRNIPVILSVLSVVGLAATTVLAIKATPKAMELIKDEKTAKGDDLTTLETIKAAWKPYVPTAIVFVGTASCIIGAAILNKRQQASMASAYALMSASYNKYKNKVKELYGEEAHRKIISSIAAERVSRDHCITAKAFFRQTSLDFGDENGDEEVTFYLVDGFEDNGMGRYFVSTVNRVLQAEYHINRNFFCGCWNVTMNDFYDLLGIEKTAAGEEAGWYLDDYSEAYWIDFNHYKTVMDDGLEVRVIEIVNSPRPMF